MKEKKETIYFEPADYIPKELRKEYGLGEYYRSKTENEKSDEEQKENNE